MRRDGFIVIKLEELTQSQHDEISNSESDGESYEEIPSIAMKHKMLRKRNSYAYDLTSHQ